MDYSINLGTAGWGVWHSPDAGKSWVRHRAPFPLNSRIQALAVLPGEPRGLLAAGDTGLFGSHDGGASWTRIGAQGDIPTVWSLAVDPSDPAHALCGDAAGCGLSLARRRLALGEARRGRGDGVRDRDPVRHPRARRPRRLARDLGRGRDRRGLPQPGRRRHLDARRPRAQRPRRARHGHRAGPARRACSPAPTARCSGAPIAATPGRRSGSRRSGRCRMPAASR